MENQVWEKVILFLKELRCGDIKRNSIIHLDSCQREKKDLEMLVPVIDIKMDKGAVETHTVQIMLVGLIQKITKLITTLDFIQSEPVSDVVKGTTYKLYFLSEDNGNPSIGNSSIGNHFIEKISNKNIYVADKRDEDVQKRLFHMRFTFKNKKYDKSKKYYLAAYDESNDMEVFRHEVIMDMAFADDFGF